MMETSAPLLTPVRFYTVAHLFSKVESPSLRGHDEVEQPVKAYSLWEARPGKHLPPYIIYDIRDMINEATKDACRNLLTARSPVLGFGPP